MWAGGPPKPVIPIRVHCAMMVPSDTHVGGWCPVTGSSGSDGCGAVTFPLLGVRPSVTSPAGAIMSTRRHRCEHFGCGATMRGDTVTFTVLTKCILPL